MFEGGTGIVKDVCRKLDIDSVIVVGGEGLCRAH